VDAVLCGELENFCGLAVDHDGRILLFGLAGLGIGGLAYLAVPQPVLARTRMSLRLLSTADCRTIWSGTAEGSVGGKRSFCADRQTDYALESLRAAVNQLVESLGLPRALAPAASSSPIDAGERPRCPREDDAEAAEKDALATARHHAEDGETAAAIEVVSRALAQRPNFAAAQLLLQDLLLHQHGTQDFLVHAERSFHPLPADEPLLGILRARSLRLADRIAEARCVLGEIRSSLPDCPLLLLEDAATLREARRMPEALAACRRALELDPESARAHEEMARTSLVWGHVDAAGAEEAARRALELEPQSTSAAVLLAKARYHGGDRKQALLFPFDLRPPADLLSHPTGHVLEKGELTPGFLFVGNVKLGLPGGFTLGTNTFRWIFKEPNALAKIRLSREAAYRPAVAIQARFLGNTEIEDSGSHSSELELLAAISKRVTRRVSVHVGGGPVFQDRDSPFALTDTTSVSFRDREDFAALDVGLHPHVKLLLEPAVVRFAGNPWEDWQATGGVLFDMLVMRFKAGVEYRSWEDHHWAPSLGMWMGR
jgi:tetratricopeptide (TPR) repeat protein